MLCKRELPVISVLFMTTIVLLDENGSVSLGLLLPLATFVAPVRLLDHPSGVIKLPLFAIGQRQPAQVRLAATVTRCSRQGTRTDHAVQPALAAVGRIICIVCIAVAVEMQLQLQKLAEVSCGGRRRRRVRCQATAGGTRGTGVGVGVGVRNRGGAAIAVSIRVEQFAGVERL